ncbi:MAG: nuclear transport factor 2 family protein [Hyphomicrobium sp.]|nr:nuclear transport factor 2 family protein [Hyphomicrobium sp.]
MKNMLAVITLSFGLATGWQAFGATIGVEGEVRALYDRFVTAQNARDLDAVRQMLSDRPNFLWISDGKPFWGREAMIGRMASFQQAEVWRVEPEFASSKVVQIDGETAYLHIPLVLVLGRKEDPARFNWLVEVLCHKAAGQWRIAALFTTEDKRPMASK